MVGFHGYPSELEKLDKNLQLGYCLPLMGKQEHVCSVWQVEEGTMTHSSVK
jgi:hypothetical protein